MEEKIIFKVSKDDILTHLTKVSKAVRDKATLPVYTYFLFEVLDNNLQITGTDTEIQIESNLQLNESSGPLSFCADKSIVVSLKTLSEQPLTFEVTKRTTIEEKTKVKTVSVSINIIHASGNININGDDSEYFTKMKNIDGDSFDIPLFNFRRGLEKTRKFTSDDQLRPVICSVYCDVKEDCIVFVGANGNGISRFEDFELKGITSGPLNIGNEVIGVLMPILNSAEEETLKITSSQSSIQMRIGDTTVTSRLVEGIYVKYNSVFPTNTKMTMTVEVKGIESRTWKTDYRGRIYIHACAWKSGRAIYQLTEEQKSIVSKYPIVKSLLDEKELMYSAIIGHVNLVDIVVDSSSVWALKDHYHWILANPVMFESSIVNVKGQLNFWDCRAYLAKAGI